jgi:protein gp37
MSENTKIEWTDHSWNPWEGCQKVGPGCDHCYAETRNARFGGGTASNWGPGAPRRRTTAANWRKMFRWNAAHAAFAAVHGRRQRVFCASLADVFDTEVPIDWFIDMLDVWRRTPSLDKLVLTKRIGNATKRLGEAFNMLMLRDDCADNPLVPWLATWIAGNAPADIWLGATIVNQAEADRDIPKLLRTPAKTRFLSMEPLLGQVEVFSKMTGELLHTSGNDYDPGSIDWIIAGGESGRGARPMSPDWARGLRDQCASAGVPFLFKQWGEWIPMLGQAESVPVGEKTTTPDGWVMGWAGKKAAGRQLDDTLHDDFPVTALDVAAACERALARGALRCNN